MKAGRPLLLPGVDRAAFAVALVARLRDAGVRVAASGPAGFVQALAVLAPATSAQLYWAARLTLVNRADDLAAFDSVFVAVFGDAAIRLGPSGPQPMLRAAPPGTPHPSGSTGSSAKAAATLPWITRPLALTAADDTDSDSTTPDALPSRLVMRAGESFDRFDADDLRLLGGWLETAVARWPRRRSLRREPNRHGKRIDLRQTLKASRSTGWELVALARTRRRRRPRRVVLICDVSRSMQPYVTIYLHLMRAAALRQAGIRPEVFAFSTALTRLTAVLAHRSPEVALQRANAKVADRYGGTRLGRSLETLLSAPHGNALRGAVVMIASDGWDSEPPEVLDRALARLRRRAALLIWLNPRAAQPGFQPLAGSMAAALPYCDLLMPAHSLTGLRELFVALGRYPVR
ncbi:MAG TPA: VWA domain-containing protein, partial [Mycobacterium sp.]|nr:VWA domain-containing protein [Mycobacterium sp.]